MPRQTRRVIVIDQRSQTMTNVKLPANVAMKKLVPALVKQLGLPPEGPGGGEQLYYLILDNMGPNEPLGENETLEDADVADGAVLQIIPYMVGRPYRVSTQYDDVPKRNIFYEPGQVTVNHAHSKQLRILFLAAEPTDIVRLRLGEELREIQEELMRARLREQFYLAMRMSVPATRISQAILDEKPNIIHFSGHGLSTGELCFEDVLGQHKPVAVDVLTTLFKLVSQQVQCVILNSCYSEIQAKAINQYIKYVIGTEKEADDKSAIFFSTGFYRALGAGESFEKAYEYGCIQIGLQKSLESSIPKLLKNNLF